jgi:hypothetical protein
MNEQIRQLAQEAGMYVDVKGEPWPKWMGAEECEVAYKKFAELIVAECADIAQQHNKSPVAAPLAIGYVIREHFGVEE